MGEGNAMGHKVNHFKGVPRDTREDFGGRKAKGKDTWTESIYCEIPTIIVFRTVITSNRTFY